jgi:succinate dehydrogenase / fumarate reductase, cytochrome b subunit
MTAAVPTKRQHKTNSPPFGQGVVAWFSPIFQTSVGGKVVIALTGLGLTGFVIMHMLGNLQIFMGQDKINTYAKFLKDLGPLLWVARIGLLVLLVLHLVLSIRLTLRARQARPIPYVHEDTIQASMASRTMIWTGLVIFAFLVFHLSHYTFGWIGTAQVVSGADVKPIGYLDLHDPAGRHDVYSMTILGFMNPVVSILYIVAQLLLLMHLSHGVGSLFQTLGVNSPRWQTTIRGLSWAVALIVGLGNIGIVAAVWAGALKLPPGITPG